MQDTIERAICRKAKQLLKRDELARRQEKKHRERFEKRTGATAAIGSHKQPGPWKVHPHFDPAYCKNQTKSLGKVIWKNLNSRQYKPLPAIQYNIPKDSGGSREIMVFSIPDAAIANLFHRKLTTRNLNSFSANCYSYRPDRNLFDAVIQLQSALAGDRIYVVQYDCKKYFDSISHSYLTKIIDSRMFLATDLERSVIKSFLMHRYADHTSYAASEFKVRSVGVPQGCSLSLFLSNVAGHELDKSLEMKNGQFVRFADDVVVVTYSYEDAVSVVSAFARHRSRSGVAINFEKSPGILMLRSGIGDLDRSLFISNGEGGEIRHAREFDYLGHKFIGRQKDLNGEVGLSSRAVKRIKKKIASIIHIHHLQNPRSRKLFDAARIGAGFHDWDLITCLNEIRRYIYGSLREREIMKFLNENEKLRRVKGLMAFYPLVTTQIQLSSLDGWLVNILRRALTERARVLASIGYGYAAPTPKQIVDGSWYNYPAIFSETECPSFVRGWRAARKYYFKYGLKDIKAPSYYSIVAAY